MRPCAILLSILVGLTIALAMAAVDVATAEAQIVIPTDDDDEKNERRDRDKKDRDKKDRDKKDRDEASCPVGREVNADTDGHCCWPGQAWNGERCVGAPTGCPDGWRAHPDDETCMPATCVDGMVMVDEANCCWPGQAWSSSRAQCLGRPESCPPATIASAEACLPDTDMDGIADDQDQCPTHAEVFDGVRDDDGCPDTAPADEIVDTREPDLARQDVAETGGIGTMGVVGWVTAGVGVAVTGGGLGLHFAAEGRRDEVREASTVVDNDGNEVRDGITQREALDAESEANTLDTVGMVLIGVGSAALLTGIALVIIDATSEADADAIGLSPAILPDGGGALVLGGRF